MKNYEQRIDCKMKYTAKVILVLMVVFLVFNTLQVRAGGDKGTTEGRKVTSRIMRGGDQKFGDEGESKTFGDVNESEQSESIIDMIDELISEW